MNNKRVFAIASDTLVYWILAIFALIGIFVLATILYNKDISALNFLKNIFRFGR